MANDFFGDLFKGITGQQEAPVQTITGTADTTGQAYGILAGQVAPGLVNFNRAMAPGITDVGLGVTNQLDPNILNNIRGAQQGFFDQLNMGESLSPELERNIREKLLETGAATGFGASPAGIGNVALQTALEGEARGRQRRSDALGAGSSGFQMARQLYDPSLYSQIGANMAGGIGADLRRVQAAMDEKVNRERDIELQNTAAIINTGGRILGTVVGGIYGGAVGAQMGGQIGGSLYTGSRVAGRQQAAGGGGGGGGMFTSLLSGMGGGGGGSTIGGPNQGIGSTSGQSFSAGQGPY